MPGRTRFLTAALILLLLTGAASDTTSRYIVDAARTKVHFTYSLPLSKGRGYFSDVSGSANIDDLALQRGSVEVTVGTRSLHADTKAAEQELRGKNFFSVAAHPRIHFQSRRVRALGPARAAVTGDMSVRGITRPIALHMTLGPRQASGARRLRATTRIRRSDFDMTAYPLFVADWVEIKIEATLLPAP